MSDPGAVLVTGASSGIGEAICRRLASTRPVILAGRSRERLEAVDAAFAYPPVRWVHDLAEPETVLDSLSRLLTDHSMTVSSFVHCAGVVQVRPIRDMEPADATAMMNVNCLSAAQIVRTLTKKRVNGATLKEIVFVSSTYSNRGARGQAVYSATKGALDAMARSLAVELAPAIRVNTVVAGGVPTRMSAASFGDAEARNRLAADYPLRLGEVADIVDAVEFLLSPRASWITGTAMVVDGGFSIR